MKFVFFVILHAWGANGSATNDSAVYADWTLSDCHNRSQMFSKKHDTPIQLCTKISEKGYNILLAHPVTFDYRINSHIDMRDEEIDILRQALEEIGKWHRGKTQDSIRVRKIIKKALQ